MRKSAFTLAEVLITLGIIGIVAVMTLPAIIQKQHEKVTIAQVKTAYSMLSQAYFRAVEENGGDISTWGCSLSDDTHEGGLCVMDRFAKFLNVVSSIRDGSDSVPYSLNLKPNTNQYYTNLHSLKLSNGFIVKFKQSGWSCKTYENWDVSEIEKVSCSIYIDVNGEKSPNALGRDVFQFKIHKQTVSPLGNQTEPYYRFWNTCKIDTSNEFWDGGVNGMSCAGWVVANENMDYLHCSGLDWDRKTKCSRLFN